MFYKNWQHTLEFKNIKIVIGNITNTQFIFLRTHIGDCVLRIFLFKTNKWNFSSKFKLNKKWNFSSKIWIEIKKWRRKYTVASMRPLRLEDNNTHWNRCQLTRWSVDQHSSRVLSLIVCPDRACCCRKKKQKIKYI